MKLEIFSWLIVIIFILMFYDVSAQRYDKKGGGIPDPQLSQKDNDYLDRQAKVISAEYNLRVNNFFNNKTGRQSGLYELKFKKSLKSAKWI
jgi:hypothetical protein